MFNEAKESRKMKNYCKSSVNSWSIVNSKQIFHKVFVTLGDDACDDDYDDDDDDDDDGNLFSILHSLALWIWKTVNW